MPGIVRDRQTWVLYVLLAWFAFLQASPGLVVPRLRDELDFSYAVAGLHVAAFAAGSTVAGLFAARLERALGRAHLLWLAAAVLALGAVGLTLGSTAPATIGSIVVMGAGGGLVLATVQAGLADHHGERRSVALAEANVAAALSYLVLVGALSLASALGVDWRVALLASLVVPVMTWGANRGLRVDAAPAAAGDEQGRLPPVFWVAVVMLMCSVAAEWCVTAWGATFVEEVAGSSPETAVGAMGGYFAGVVLGRVLGSRLARRYDAASLFAGALALTLVGFAVLWPSSGPAQAAAGLTLLGIGLGNLFPMGLSVAVSLAPGRSTAASGRIVLMTSAAILFAPLTVGALADATSLEAALGVVPLTVVLAAVALAVVRRGREAAVGSRTAG